MRGETALREGVRDGGGGLDHQGGSWEEGKAEEFSWRREEGPSLPSSHWCAHPLTMNDVYTPASSSILSRSSVPPLPTLPPLRLMLSPSVSPSMLGAIASRSSV